MHPLEGRDRILTVPPGEEAKSLAVVERIWRELELDRDGMLIAFGGGSTTDVAGFAAATYKRGVKWTAIPTTLTGMVDAAIGGKTGINTARGKEPCGRLPLSAGRRSSTRASWLRFLTRSGARAWPRW